MNIIDYIPTGKENAVSTNELKILTGLKDIRSVRKQIAAARLKGAVICSSLQSDGGGYFLPECPEEAVEYVRTEQLRISSAKQALQGAVNYVSDGKDV